MKQAKQVLAVFLIIALLISAIPVTVFAKNEVSPMDDAVEAIEANLQNEQEAEKKALEDREEQIKNNTVEVTSGSNTGYVLEDGKTYVFKKDVKFTNSTPSGSAITVPAGATAVMQIEKGVTVTAIGADSETPLGAGAGIYVPESATLIIRGEGTLNATGGNAANGENGSKGENALLDQDARNGNGIMYAGNGGMGGAGGGGAGAGIGGTGGNGGLGGLGGLYKGYRNGQYTYPFGTSVSDITLVSKPEGESENERTNKLFDNNFGTNCLIKKSGKISVVFRTSRPEKIVSYIIAAPKQNDSEGGTPSSWVLYGSNDNVEWKELSTVNAPKVTKAFFNNSLFANNVTAGETYRYFKIDFESTDFLRLSRIALSRAEENHPASATEDPQADWNGNDGEEGASGNNGSECGVVYILEQVSVTATPGKSGAEGKAGKTGNKANDKGSKYNYYYYASGGGGGGAGAGGRAPKFGIGAGGAGGAGGGGGGAGSTRFSKKDRDYDNDNYAKGGTGGNAYSKGEDGSTFGSQKGGNGGRGGEKTGTASIVSGIIRADYDAKIEGRLEGDIERGIFIIDDDGFIVDSTSISVTDIESLVLEDNKHYRFANNISYTAPETENAITVPENSKITLEVPNNIKVSLNGGNARGINGAGAGIFVPASSTLIIRGSGVLEAKGGDAFKATANESGGGAGAGIGGAGGKGISDESATPERGTDCGTVYILGALKLTAKPGRSNESDSSSYCGGKAPDYGIGGGGAGGNAAKKSVQLSGDNGDIYLDYTSVYVGGRDSFYHKADLSVDVLGNVSANGYTDMILGNPYYDNLTEEYLYKALREVANHNALKKGERWKVVDMSEEKDVETNASSNGAYRKGYEWNKDILDFSGGYVYLFTTYFGRYIKDKYDIPSPNILDLFAHDPSAIVNSCWRDISNYAKSLGLYINDDMKTLMSEILYHEHYCEPFGGNRSSGYTGSNPTSKEYNSKKEALQQIDYSYTSVLDCTTARYATFAYDTARERKDKVGKSKYYYRMIQSTFMCVDGYKGVTMKNWMKYIPDDASVSQLNMPGSHDSGTCSVGFNTEVVNVILDNFDKIYKDNVSVEETLEILTGALAGIKLLAAFGPMIYVRAPFIINIAAQVLAVYGVIKLSYIAAHLPEILQLVVDSLSQCQNLTIEQQLNAGLRTFDIRMVYNHKKNHNFKDDLKALDDPAPKDAGSYYKADYLKVSHGSLSKIGFGDYSDYDISLTDGYNPDGSVITFRDVIQYALDFVHENPSESVYLTLKREGDGDDKDGIYTKVLKKVFEEAKNDPNVVVIEEKDEMPTVGEAAGKVYLIERRFAEFRDDSYDVSAKEKIKILKECFDESNNMRQNYDAEEKIGDVRMVYSSTYDYEFNEEFLYKPFEDEILLGSPEELAIGMGAKSINHYLDTYAYRRGQYYGWIYMNFPTQMATSNLVFSNIFDMEKLVNEHDEGSLFTDFNGVVFFGLLAAFAVPVIAIPIVKKKKSKKANSTENEEADKE